MHGLDPDLVRAVLDDWRTAPVPARLRAGLEFCETLTLRPTEITAARVRQLAEAGGLGARALREAAYVCFLFNVLDRTADALNFPLPDEREARRIGTILFKGGYRAVKLPG